MVYSTAADPGRISPRFLDVNEGENKMNIFKSLLLLILITGFSTVCLYAQMFDKHGDFSQLRNGIHAGNQFRTSFYNDGTFGAIEPDDYGGEWPINSGHIYLSDGNVFVGSEVIDMNGQQQHIFSTVRSSMTQASTGDTGPNGEWYTFLPLPGFANPNERKIAMSKWNPKHTINSWPQFWPDIADPDNVVYSPDGWAGSWNGYFGRDIFNADEESYFVADDYQNQEFAFQPDSLDPRRGGLGIRMYVRGFQWSNALVEDALFILFDLENIGTYNHDKMVFAYKIGNNMGDTENDSDGGDDSGEYNREQDIAYLFDFDDIGGDGFTPVGYFGGVFLESPGNPYDGIDNDGDGSAGAGSMITEEMFLSEILNAGDEIVVIDYSTFNREVIPMPDDTLRIQYQDTEVKFWPGKEIVEYPFNLIDDNLNGIIDENNGVTFQVEEGEEITTYLYVGLKYIDYVSGVGTSNPLIDEERNDGIDNDGDWNVEFDDVGKDGHPYTNDEGEEDGQPTVGEPHFEKTDIDETDMLGLTSFTLYKWESMPHYNDLKVWTNTIPGYFDTYMESDNVELLYSSGYFPMKSGQINRFSMGLLCGLNIDDFFENKRWLDKAYNENYNFTRAPLTPTVTAVAGDNRVTLYWDDVAESSVDPITGEDFEGYAIYRSTDPGWNDMPTLTDYNGIPSSFRIPLEQFDLDNDFEGPAEIPIRGIHFNLGTNSGLVHSWVDTTAKNGYTYYYAVTSYDHGNPDTLIAPTECAKFITINKAGEVEDKGPNVVIVRPEAPAAGHVAADFDSSKVRKIGNSTTEAYISYEIIEPADIKDNHRYQISFEDQLVGVPATLRTKNFTLTDITDDTVLIDRSARFHEEEQPLIDGFKIKLHPIETDFLEMNDEASSWNRDSTYLFNIEPPANTVPNVELIPGDFEIAIGDVGIDTSTACTVGTSELPGIPVNFTIRDLTHNQKVKFGFKEDDANTGEEGMFTFRSAGSRRDFIYLLTDSMKISWKIDLRANEDTTKTIIQPSPGDTLTLALFKPFLSNDVFEFTTHTSKVYNSLQKEQMKNIKVVPNPYIIANSWEPANPYANGRGPRVLHFIHLPPKCTIKIFNIRGQLVRELIHDAPSSDGTEIWDMLTRDNLEIAYGVYVYYVEAKGIGEKIDKFAVIK